MKNSKSSSLFITGYALLRQASLTLGRE